MALIEVKVPQLSESVAEATLLQWRKKPGQAVELDEILVEIETDKVVLEVPAPAAGVLAQVIKNDGDSCIADEVIAKIDTEGEEPVSAPMQIKSIPPAEPAPGAKPGVHAARRRRPSREHQRSGDARGRKADGRQRGIAPPSVTGTGRDGRVTKGDVLEALASGTPASAKPPPVQPAAPPAVAPVTKPARGEPPPAAPASRCPRCRRLRRRRTTAIAPNNACR